jgi:hypothetical protein
LNKNQYTTSDLQLKIGDYTFRSQFVVASMFSGGSDIILGLDWMETLGSLILNVKKMFLTFCYKKKKITLQDFSMTSELKTPSSKDFNDTTKMILQNNEKSIHKVHK